MDMETGRNVPRGKKVYENSARLTTEHRRPHVWEKTQTLLHLA